MGLGQVESNVTLHGEPESPSLFLQIKTFLVRFDINLILNGVSLHALDFIPFDLIPMLFFLLLHEALYFAKDFHKLHNNFGKICQH